MKTKNLKEYTSVGSLYVSKELLKFVNNEVLRGTKIKPKNFWSGFEKSLHVLKPKNENEKYLIKDAQNKIINNSESLQNLIKKIIWKKKLYDIFNHTSIKNKFIF